MALQAELWTVVVVVVVIVAVESRWEKARSRASVGWCGGGDDSQQHRVRR